MLLWPKIKAFIVEKKQEPDLNSHDMMEKRLAECLVYLKEQRRKQEL
jgi:hypothetical protein